jgi:hypothetical protein
MMVPAGGDPAADRAFRIRWCIAVLTPDNKKPPMCWAVFRGNLWSGKEDSNLRPLRPEPVPAPFPYWHSTVKSLKNQTSLCNNVQESATKCTTFLEQWSKIGAKFLPLSFNEPVIPEQWSAAASPLTLGRTSLPCPNDRTASVR